jgi:hypothetical protein
MGVPSVYIIYTRCACRYVVSVRRAIMVRDIQHDEPNVLGDSHEKI